MRTRLAAAFSLLALAGVAAVPAAASAAKVGMGVTINSIPNPSVAGDALVIYGHTTSARAGKPIHLYAVVLPKGIHQPEPRPALIEAGTVSPNGSYEFRLPAGSVETNRHFEVIASKVLRSRTVPQEVIPALSLASSTSKTETGKALVLSGRITPRHAREPIVLESQIGSTGNVWQVLARGKVNQHARYSFRHTFTTPGIYTLRAVFLHDRQNTDAVSDVSTVVVQQAPAAGFSASTSAAVVAPGKRVTISGALDMTNSTVPASPGTVVQLWGHAHGGKYAKLDQTTAGVGGRYSFTAAPSETEIYQARMAAGKPRASAQVVVGVQQSLTISSRPGRSGELGRTATFTGHISPAASHGLVVLQRRGPHGVWVTVRTGVVKRGSKYRLRWSLGVPGKETFRVVVPGDPFVVTAVSATRTIKVSVPAVQSLPRAT